MKLQLYLTEITQPTVKMTTEVLTNVFKIIRSIFERYDLFDINDDLALRLMKHPFDTAGIKLVMGDKKGNRKYISSGEFGGNYGGDYAWLIKMKPGFSKVFKRFATSRGWKYLEDPVKNPLFRELVEILSHEILHTQQALGSNGAAFDPEIQKMKSTYSGSYEDYLKHPLEIEAYAQQAAIDTIRKGEKNSPVFQAYKEYFPKGSNILKKFLKKYSFYLSALKKEGDIKSYK